LTPSTATDCSASIKAAASPPRRLRAARFLAGQEQEDQQVKESTAPDIGEQLAKLGNSATDTRQGDRFATG
jgi:hypothetical protein